MLPHLPPPPASPVVPGNRSAQRLRKLLMAQNAVVVLMAHTLRYSSGTDAFHKYAKELSVAQMPVEGLTPILIIVRES